jgi:hypothetical protein
MVGHHPRYRQKRAVSDEKEFAVIVTRKAIARRTVLRGIGATLALPLLDSMVPAFAAAAKPVTRLGVFYVPNGVLMESWTPAVEGATFEFTPILAPLASFREQLLVLSGFDSKVAWGLAGEGSGDHSRGCASFLTGVHIRKTDGRNLENGISLDQIAATELGRHTQLASLELALESNELVGACDVGYSCAYSNTISWRSATTPMPVENNPRAVFERLFGGTGSTERTARLARVRKDRSILDSVLEETADLRRGLGPGDQTKVAGYLEAIRDVERRIQKAEEQSDRELPVIVQPTGIPETFEEHIKLMFDLQVLAYQVDLTRVITFMTAREISNRSYPAIGVREAHHALSHHGGDPEKIAKKTKIDTYHVRMFADFLERLRSTPDGDGTLLDHSLIIYGSGLSNGNIHAHDDLPILVAGAGSGQIKGGRHIRNPRGTPLSNLHVTVLQKLGIPTERVGDSTGPIRYLSEV